MPCATRPLSAAFDTVDHNLLLNISDMDLMKPYLTGFLAPSDQEHNKG